MSPIGIDKLKKYISGKSNPEDEAQVHAWLDCNDANEYPKTLDESGYIRKEQKIWDRLMYNLEGIAPLSPKTGNGYKVVFRYAAALVFLLLSAIVYNHYSNGDLWWTGEKYSTDYGETKHISLSDGTLVTLNAGSELKVTRNYGKHKRELYLKGEAYFKVEKDPSKPFVVYSNGLSTTALGTEFNVYAYPNSKKTRVSLHEGKVAVKTVKCKQKSSLTLKPGEEAIFQSSHLTKRTFVEKERLSWTKDVLYFNEADLSEVIHKLQRYYGVKIDHSGLKGYKWKLNGEFKHQPIKNVLESLAFTYGIKYQINGNNIKLYQ